MFFTKSNLPNELKLININKNNPNIKTIFESILQINPNVEIIEC